MPPIRSHTIALTEDQAETLRSILKEEEFVFAERPYTIFFAQKPGLTIAVYEKGPKAVIQGKDTEHFIQFTLEPRVTGEVRLGYEELHHPERFEPHFGIDESGKGDFFGPLIIAGVYTDATIARSLMDAGIRDSKSIGSDAQIRKFAEIIRKTPRLISKVVVINPKRYNEMFASFKNLNRLLAWGHACVIEELCGLCPSCPTALSDKFANESVLKRALKEKGRSINLLQQTKAESDYAVAAASILARERFIDWLDASEKKFKTTFPKGASAAVVKAARDLVEKYDSDILSEVAKLHFKTSSQVLASPKS